MWLFPLLRRGDVALGVADCNNPVQVGSVLDFWELIPKMDSRHIPKVSPTLLDAECPRSSYPVPLVVAELSCLS